MRTARGIHDHPARKLGIIPAAPKDYARVIPLRLTGAVPAHPVTADFIAGIPSWIMGGNDRFGTCGPVSIANYVRLLYWWLTGELVTITDDAVFDLYRRSGNPDFDPATGAGDGGVEMPVLLDALLKGGIAVTHDSGVTEQLFPLCYARFDLANLDELRAATSICGGGILAGELETAQQAQTDASPPVWDYKPSGEWGGHAFMGGAYTSADAPGAVDESVVSWALRVGTTDAFLRNQLQEGYAVIFRMLWDHPTFQAGVDQAALAADYQAITGRTIPVPAPPSPPPNPPPMPTPAADVDARYAGDPELIAWAKSRHVGENAYAARQFRQWRQARGFSIDG